MIKNKLVIGINGTVFKNPITGVAKRLINLILELQKLNPEIEFIIFSPHRFQITPLKNVAKVISLAFLGEWFWLNFQLPRLMKKHSVTIFDSIWGGGLPNKKFCHYVVTYHDFIELDALHDNAKKDGLKSIFLKIKIKWLKKKITRHSLTASKIVFVSKQALSRFHFHFNSTQEEFKKATAKKAVVIPNGIYLVKKNKKKDEQFFQAVKKNNSIKKYFFYVGGFNPRKNLPALLNAFKLYAKKERDPFHLLLAGQENNYFKKKISSLIQKEKKIISLGYLKEEILSLFYENSELFFYPSLKEGFGMPPLEALSLGKTAVVDKNLPLNDWKLRGLIAIDMSSVREITEVMKKRKKLAPNEDNGDKTEQLQRNQLQPFSWSNLAHDYHEKVIKKLL